MASRTSGFSIKAEVVDVTDADAFLRRESVQIQKPIDVDRFGSGS